MRADIRWIFIFTYPCGELHLDLTSFPQIPSSQVELALDTQTGSSKSGKHPFPRGGPVPLNTSSPFLSGEVFP